MPTLAARRSVPKSTTSAPVWVFSPVRIRPTASTSRSASTARTAPTRCRCSPPEPGGLLQRHSLPLQLHDDGDRARRRPYEVAGAVHPATPARLGYSLEPPTPPSADGPKLRRKLSFSRKRSDKVDLDGRCALYISRVDPRVFGLRLADGKLLVFSAYSNGEGLMWLVALASAIATHRSAEPSHAAFEEVVVRDGQPAARRQRHRGARAALADLVRAGQLERVTVTAEAAAALRFGLKHDEVLRIATSTSRPTASPLPPSRGVPVGRRRRQAPTKALVQSEARHEGRARRVRRVRRDGRPHRLCAPPRRRPPPRDARADGRIGERMGHRPRRLRRRRPRPAARAVAGPAVAGGPAPAEPAPPPPPRRSAPPDDPPRSKTGRRRPRVPPLRPRRAAAAVSRPPPPRPPAAGAPLVPSQAAAGASRTTRAD